MSVAEMSGIYLPGLGCSGEVAEPIGSSVPVRCGRRPAVSGGCI